MPYPEYAERGEVLHGRVGAVAHIRFNRPDALNAIDTRMAAGFLRACVDIAADREVRAVWISGAGRTFMAGGDVSEMATDGALVADQLIAGMHGGLRLLAGIDAPVVASVQGAVAGGGLGLLLGAADLILAAEGTRFSVAYPLIGASCDCSTSWSLPRVVGFHKALELLLLSEPVEATQALRLGLCNQVVPLGELEERARALVDRLAAGPTIAYGRLRRLARASLSTTFEQQLDAEAAGFRACADTADFKEGVAAFIGKRKPSFGGH